jgi:hypothetical protein
MIIYVKTNLEGQIQAAIFWVKILHLYVKICPEELSEVLTFQ